MPGETRDGTSPFGRILVGVDGTEPGLAACRQAARLAERDAFVEAVTVVNLAEAVLVGPGAPRMADELRREAEEALDDALAVLGEGAQRRLLQGTPVPELLREVRERKAGVLAIGSHGHRRVAEMILGGTAGELLHEAPCSVLVAREPDDPELFPRSVVVGIDASSQADVALGVAQNLARRFGSRLRIIAAGGGKEVNLADIRRSGTVVDEVDAQPVAALVDASLDADLVVVGSRGLHGLRALGSVSERVAHQAPCSVLVVR